MYCLRTSCTHPTIEWCLKDCSSSSESSFRETKEDRVHSYLISRFGAWTILVSMLQLPDDVLLAAPRWNLTMRSSGHSRLNQLCWNVLCWMSTAECSDISTRFCNTVTTRILPGIWLISGQKLFSPAWCEKKRRLIFWKIILSLIAIQEQENVQTFTFSRLYCNEYIPRRLQSYHCNRTNIWTIINLFNRSETWSCRKLLSNSLRNKSETWPEILWSGHGLTCWLCEILVSICSICSSSWTRNGSGWWTKLRAGRLGEN